MYICFQLYLNCIFTFWTAFHILIGFHCFIFFFMSPVEKVLLSLPDRSSVTIRSLRATILRQEIIIMDFKNKMRKSQNAYHSLLSKKSACEKFFFSRSNRATWEQRCSRNQYHHWDLWYRQQSRIYSNHQR